jgi:hypothetical protein
MYPELSGSRAVRGPPGVDGQVPGQSGTAVMERVQARPLVKLILQVVDLLHERV